MARPAAVRPRVRLRLISYPAGELEVKCLVIRGALADNREMATLLPVVAVLIEGEFQAEVGNMQVSCID